MKPSITKVASALVLSAAAALAGQDVSTKQALTLDGARRAADAAVAYAKANGAPGSAIAVVDDGGHLLYFIRLDGTFTASPNISIGKARTAVLFKKPTADLEKVVNQGRFAMTALPPDFTPLQGGVPILHGDQIVGAIGVSGAKSAAQDEAVAYAGAQALAVTKTASRQ